MKENIIEKYQEKMNIFDWWIEVRYVIQLLTLRRNYIFSGVIAFCLTVLAIFLFWHFQRRNRKQKLIQSFQSKVPIIEPDYFDRRRSQLTPPIIYVSPCKNDDNSRSSLTSGVYSAPNSAATSNRQSRAMSFNPILLKSSTVE